MVPREIAGAGMLFAFVICAIILGQWAGPPNSGCEAREGGVLELFAPGLSDRCER